MRWKGLRIASAAPFLPIPRLSFYDVRFSTYFQICVCSLISILFSQCLYASEAAVYSMYVTVELGSEIGITIVIPGLIKSEMTREKILNQQVKLELEK